MAQNHINKNGYNKFYYSNGKLSSEGYLVDGKPDSCWKNYYESGIIKSEGNRKNFLLDSLWKFYYENGIINQEINYKQGKKFGLLNNFNTNGLLISSELYKDDLKEGLSEYYHENSKLKFKVNFEKNKEQGKAYEYDINGKIISISHYSKGVLTYKEFINKIDKDGLKQGLWIDFDKDEKIKNEITFLNNKKNGLYKRYDSKGNLIEVINYSNDTVSNNNDEVLDLVIEKQYFSDGKVKSFTSFKNGKKQGISKVFNDSGVVISSSIYKEDVLIGEGIIDEMGFKQGKWKEYYLTGELKCEGKYIDEKKVEKWIFYYPSGKVEQTGVYGLDGKLNGEWCWFYESSQLWRKEFYRKGKRDGLMEEYNENGQIVSKGEYMDGEKEGFWYYQMGDHREEGNYKSDKMDGIWKFYYQNNTISFEGNYIDGEPEGIHRYYWENGKIKEEGNYVMGKKEGKWKNFDLQGNINLIILYKDGIEKKYNGVKIKPDNN